MFAQIKDILQDLSRDEPWHANRFVFDVALAAINALFLTHQPSGEGKPETRARLQATYGEKDPDKIGRIVAFVAVKAYARERWGKALLEESKG